MKRLSTQGIVIGDFIYEKINDILPVYPVIANEGACMPFATYRRVAFRARDTKDRYNYEETVSLEIRVVAESWSESAELAGRIKDRLEHYRGRWRDLAVTDIAMTDSSEDYVEGGFMQRLYFSIDIDNSLLKNH